MFRSLCVSSSFVARSGQAKKRFGRSPARNSCGHRPTVEALEDRCLLSGSWATEPSMPGPRSQPMAAATDTRLYVAGGWNGGEVTSLYSYDPANKSWVGLASLPDGGRYAGSTAVTGGKLYLMGGYRASLPTSTLFVYDPAADSWTRKADMPTVSACSSAGVIGEKIYVTTGCTGGPPYRNFLHVYDTATNTWASRASSPHIHAYPATGVIDGKLYVAGGTDGNVYFKDLDVYDPVTDSWVTKAPMLAARAGMAGGVVNGRLYSAGGTEGGAQLAKLEFYDPVRNTWAAETNMPTPRQELSAAVIGQTLYAVGGGFLVSNVLSTVEAFTAIPNRAPAAADDSYSVNRLEQLRVSTPGVLANDRDADGDALAAVLVNSPTHGVVTFNSDGSFSYQPDGVFLGADTFTYKANDGSAVSSLTTVSVRVQASMQSPVIREFSIPRANSQPPE